MAMLYRDLESHWALNHNNSNELDTKNRLTT